VQRGGADRRIDRTVEIERCRPARCAEIEVGEPQPWKIPIGRPRKRQQERVDVDRHDRRVRQPRVQPG
jgi:hypothetical protein